MFSGTLPKVVADTGPGGGLPTAYKALNELQKENITNKFLPYTLGSNALSKIAFSSLVGPQAAVKLLGNEAAMANMTPEQQKAALRMANSITAGQGQGGTPQQATNAMVSNQMNGSQQGDQNPLSNLVNFIKTGFGFNKGSAQPQQQANPMAQQPNVSPQDQNAMNNLQPGQSYVVQGNNQAPGYGASDIPNNLSPTEHADMVSGRPGTLPGSQPPQQPAQQAPEPTSGTSSDWFKNKADAEGIVAQGKTSGTERGKQIANFGDQYETTQAMKTSLDDINRLVASPIAETIRQIPLLGHREVQWLEKQGTPEQKDFIGKFKAQIGTLQQDMSTKFKGSFRGFENNIIQNTKVDPSDTIEVMKGKAQTLSYMNDIAMKRAELANGFMEHAGLSKLDALKLADKQIDPEKIRHDVHNILHPFVVIKNKKTGESKQVPIAEARHQYGVVPNV